jgi:hypothetical protein
MKKMKIVLIFFIVVIHTNICLSQITGRCIDTLRNPLPYVNIGLKNSSVGTVTNTEGRFVIDDKSLVEDNCIVFSHIGYKSKSVVVPKQSEIEIVLQQTIYQLDKVIIVPSKNTFTKTKRIGPKILTEHVVAGFYSNNLGAEVGRFFKLDKGKKYKVERVHFNIAELGYKKGTFRVNFYNAMDEKNIETVRCNKNDIIMDVPKVGDVDIDLTKENLIFENSFLATIEWIDFIENNILSNKEQNVYFSSNVFCGPVYYRSNNLKKWTVSKQKYDMGLGIQLFVKY